MSQIIRLTEGDLHRLVKEAVDKILSEGRFDPKWSTRDGEAPNGDVFHDMPRRMPRNTPNSSRRNKGKLEEEGEAGGGGATNCAGTMQGGGTNPGAGQYDVPAFGGKKPKKVGGNAFDQPIRKPSPVGEPTNKKDKGVDVSSALSRPAGKIAMGGRAEWHKN